MAHAALVGAGATLLTDAWTLMRKRLLGTPRPDYGLVGRWVAHFARFTFLHDRIATSAPHAHERTIGWTTHYAVGIAFAVLLVAIAGSAWLQRPTLLPALAFGIATALAPFGVMQPAMGAGIASSRTPTPLKNCLRSLASHTVFGAGLYLSALFLSLTNP